MKYLILIIFTFTMISCATVTRGRTQAFTITSEPTSALVTMSNGLTCTTPCTLTVDRRPGFVVTVSKEGYETVNATVASQVAGAGSAGMAGNLLLGGVIGAGVDASTGAMNELVPNPLHVILPEE